MQRVAFVMKLKPGNEEEEYKRRHDEIWPEMLAALRSAGIHNYSIFLHGEQLFAYLEVDDFDRMAQALATDPANARWQAYMQPMIEVQTDERTGFSTTLKEMFHMD
ncbi:MAG: L-rhamnose mutarotase [Ktedonobacteraceae bacterium]|nr:L-rhamnose mutarotase [Ktedonobacteraceae bacterium]MBO0796258.1 L-rhamnose mutarotase [Ktedonobacteraceae bacterium]